MKVRMLESVAGLVPLRTTGFGSFHDPFALDPGEVYDLAPTQAQQLMTSGRAVSVPDEPLPPSTSSPQRRTRK